MRLAETCRLNPPSDLELAAVLLSDERTGSDFRALLDRTALVYFPAVSTAASGEVRTRTAGPHRIRFGSSRAGTGQVYVVIELVPATNAPSTLFVCGDGWRTRKIDLPPPQGGVIQIFLEQSDDILRSLRDPNAEVFLC